MKKLLLITTGGTIASVATDKGLAPGLQAKDILEYVKFRKFDFELDTISLFSIDSTDIRPEHWLLIKQTIKESYDKYDGFVITHGTDTLAYTASALGYLIQKSPKPIVITGAQKSISNDITDAKNNLIDALIFASKEKSHGVNIVFNGKVICGNRARKVRTKSFDAFDSINYPLIAIIHDGKVLRYIDDKSDNTVEFYDKLDESVYLLKLIPSMRADILEDIFEKYDCIIVESYGVGGMPAGISEEFLRLMEQYSTNKIIVMTTQVPQEGSDIGVYQVGMRIREKLDVLESKDMTLESVVCKMMYVMGKHNRNIQKIQDEFYSIINHDISIIE